MGGTWGIICVIPPSLILPPSVAVIQICRLNCTYWIMIFLYIMYIYNIQGKIKKNKEYVLHIRNILIFLCSFHANCLCIKYWRFSLELSINHMHPNMLKLCIAQYLSWNQNNINHLLAKLLMICKEEYLWAAT